MSDGYHTRDAWFAAAMQYLYGEEVLTRIETKEDTGGRPIQSFHLSVDTQEAGKCFQDYQNGEFALSDLKCFVRTYGFLTRRLREMRKRGETSWVSDGWIRGEV
jgi:hypothetical protein